MRQSVRRSITPCLLLLMLPMAGCVTETATVDDKPQLRNPDGIPAQVLRVPQLMQDLSGSLLRYHAKHRILPPSIETLMDEKIITPQQLAELPDYAYHPEGLGRLGDGRVVILADAEVRIEGHLWCIVREPTGQPQMIQLNVTPIALGELQAAARRAR